VKRSVTLGTWIDGHTSPTPKPEQSKTPVGDPPPELDATHKREVERAADYVAVERAKRSVTDYEGTKSTTQQLKVSDRDVERDVLWQQR